jgi:hypothetical protein
VLGALGAAAAVVVWRFGLDPTSPRELLRQRLSPPATPLPTTPPPTTPPRPAAPPAPKTAPAPSPPAAAPAPAPAASPAAVTPPPTTPPPAAPAPPRPSPATPAPAPARPAPAAPPAPAATPPGRASKPAEAAPVAAVIATPAPSRRAEASAPHFAIEFGPFFGAVDAERLERRLTEAGYATVRFRQPTGGAVYAVLIERIPTAHEGRTIAAALREQGLGEAVVVSTDPVALRVGPALPLRGSVELAERVRAAGHQVRVAAQPGEASAFMIRHGNFASRGEAEAKRRELAPLDLPAHQVVQVR